MVIIVQNAEYFSKMEKGHPSSAIGQAGTKVVFFSMLKHEVSNYYADMG
jgi:hypothetical protein